MADFLLELLSEEIPARMQARARGDLQRMMAEALHEAALGHGAITVYSTPRRLALIIRDVAGATEAVSEELKGPRTSAPAQALEGFLRKTGLGQGQLEDRGGTWFAVIDRPGRAASEVIAEAVMQIIADFPWPKSMRWGDGDLRWVRPLHSIVALLGDDIVPVEVAGVAVGATTLGHRFHHPGPITIGGAGDYVEKLRACHVLVDQAERETLIRDGAAKAAQAAGFALIEDEGLVVENAGLTEWPVPLAGQFDPDFLDVPREVIVLTMRTNQKYFACTGDDGGELAPAFVCIANIDANDGGVGVIEGNRRVLAARLADARFFWEQDLKVPLEEQAKKLDGIVFHEKLGSVADKVERVAKLARWLVENHIVIPAKAGTQRNKKKLGSRFRGNDEEVAALADEVERAARLAKSDLVTGMVGEFPELQGVIGGYLAEAQGESKAVAEAIRDHYKPVGQGDEVPTAPGTVAVSLADKLDTALSFLSVDLGPTGSKDPYAIRRAILSSASLILQNRARVSLNNLIWTWISIAFEVMSRDFDQSKERNDEITRRNLQLMALFEKLNGQAFAEIREDARAALKPLITGAEQVQFAIWNELLQRGKPSQFAEFRHLAIASTTDRLKVQQREAGVRHDLIDAVFALGGEDDLVRLLARVKALQAFVETDEGTNLLAAYKRAANILKKEEGTWTPDQVRGDDEVAAEEAALAKALDSAEPKATAAVEKEDFTAAMAALASLRGPIDSFFDQVKVNAEDAAVRARRLNLLARFRDAVNQVADFSKIEG